MTGEPVKRNRVAPRANLVARPIARLIAVNAARGPLCSSLPIRSDSLLRKSRQAGQLLPAFTRHEIEAEHVGVRHRELRR